MAATQRNLVADDKTTFRLSVRWRQANGVPVDVSAKTVTFEVRQRSTAGTLVASYPGSGTSDGWLSVVVDDAVVTTWSGPYAYRLLAAQGTDVDAVLVGRLSVRTGRDV